MKRLVVNWYPVYLVVYLQGKKERGLPVKTLHKVYQDTLSRASKIDRVSPVNIETLDSFNESFPYDSERNFQMKFGGRTVVPMDNIYSRHWEILGEMTVSFLCRKRG